MMEAGQDSDEELNIGAQTKGGKKPNQMAGMLSAFNSQLKNKVGDLTDTNKNFYYLKVTLGQKMDNSHHMVRAAVMHGDSLATYYHFLKCVTRDGEICLGKIWSE